MILEGYRRYGKTEGVYRVPTPANWIYVITPKSLLEEFKRPDVKVLSTHAALIEILSFDYIFDKQIKPLDYHLPLLVGPVTKNIGSTWIEHKDDDTLVQLMDESTHEVMKASQLLQMVPILLKTLMISLVTNLPEIRKRAKKILYPVVHERLRKFEEGPDYTNKEALYAIVGELSSRPEYIELIRKEIAIVVSKYGWSKTALSEMVRLESFIMESLRLNPISDCLMTIMNAVTSPRKATKDYVLRNGMCIPKGSLVLLPQFAVHMDDEVYPEPSQFRGFRFCTNPSLESGEEPTNLTHRLTRIGPDFLLFGIGDRACPGRFFAMTNLKIAMAHLIQTYDFKADPASPYKYRHNMTEMITDPNFTLLLKARN